MTIPKEKLETTYSYFFSNYVSLYNNTIKMLKDLLIYREDVSNVIRLVGVLVRYLKQAGKDKKSICCPI